MPLQHSIRIHSGQWRGRKIALPPQHTIRPTTGRVKETLFNWLRPHLVQAHCLDLFSGSGNLAFEALSNGAAHCLCLDSNPQHLAAIDNTARLFQTSQLQTQAWDFPQAAPIPKDSSPFAIVFADPPYHHISPQDLMQWLHQHSHLTTTGTLLFLETHRSHPLPQTGSWAIYRQQQYGQSQFTLWKKL